MRVRIKKVNEKNYDEWVDLRKYLWPGSEFDEELKTYFDEESKWNYVNDPVWIAYVGKKSVGFIEISIHQTEPWHQTKMSYIEGVYVIPELHKKGIASKMVYIATKWSRKRKLNFIGSDTQVDNDVSIKMHLALGFRYVATIDGEAKFVKGIE